MSTDVQPDLHDGPHAEEHERGPEQARHPAPDERPGGLPSRRYESYVTRFENPPTKKKIGMTWKIHVPNHRPEESPTALTVRIMPWSQTISRDEPVAEHHGDDARRPKEVHEPVPGGRSGRGELVEPAHGTNRESIVADDCAPPSLIAIRRVTGTPTESSATRAPWTRAGRSQDGRSASPASVGC